jgi:hypothetical protein
VRARRPRTAAIARQKGDTGVISSTQSPWHGGTAVMHMAAIAKPKNPELLRSGPRHKSGTEFF